MNHPAGVPHPAGSFFSQGLDPGQPFRCTCHVPRTTEAKGAEMTAKIRTSIRNTVQAIKAIWSLDTSDDIA